jgi:hypothetical protein
VKDWAKVAIGLSIAALLLVVWPKITSTPQKNTKSATPGWEDLILCSELVSFDGKKTLSLFDDGTAELKDNSDTEKLSAKGKWVPGNAPNRYSIQFENKDLHYERIAPEGWGSCMLVFGTSFGANLQLSWFAVEPELDPPDDR